jgi:hypothetical protein
VARIGTSPRVGREANRGGGTGGQALGECALLGQLQEGVGGADLGEGDRGAAGNEQQTEADN